ncbi:UNVERIFIED_CONTAM: hypothetical protein Slati_3971600 [Sesamum latifolium]|uniref:Endonuclease/exonuclease/phosphatase domain-containing protein n=1 Tax=Sesamum latifolium TaxID=2727402 RepID=A0AAW2TPB6_9LAMI
MYRSLPAEFLRNQVPLMTPPTAEHAAGGVDSHNNSPQFSPTAHKGNRIWLAWDETEVEVDILIVHYQCIHCRVFVKRAHLSSLVTVVYGHNEVVPRRELWEQLSSILDNMGDEPWLVMGDFNTVLDMSEVHGPSGDFSVAMEDSSACLRNTGLLHVPMQRDTYTWHNWMGLAASGRYLIECWLMSSGCQLGRA